MLRRLLAPLYEKLLKTEISATPSHVAVIQDGNRRFARERGEDPSKGHVYGAETTEALLEWAADLDVREVTLYTLSTENLGRPDHELQQLYDLMEDKLDDLKEDDRVHEHGIKIQGVGDVDRLPTRVREALREAELETSGYNDYVLNLAVGYGGRNELLHATHRVMEQVEKGDLDPGEIDTEVVSNHLYTDAEHDIDLIIRSGGDERISNFLPWQAKGNESAVYFCAPYWPEFRQIDFLRAIRTYGYREQERSDREERRAVALVRELGRDNVKNKLRSVAEPRLDEA